MAASPNILIVDDDPDIRQVLKILLSETYTVAEASRHGGRRVCEGASGA